MEPPPACSQSPPSRLLEPKLPTTAASLKKFILQRDRIFAAFLVKFLLSNFESLTFETPQPLAWPYVVDKTNDRGAMKTSVDEHIGFRAYEWSSRYCNVAKLVEEDLTTRGFEVKHIKLYEAAEINENLDMGLVIVWSVSPPV